MLTGVATGSGNPVDPSAQGRPDGRGQEASSVAVNAKIGVIVMAPVEDDDDGTADRRPAAPRGQDPAATISGWDDPACVTAARARLGSGSKGS